MGDYRAGNWDCDSWSYLYCTETENQVVVSAYKIKIARIEQLCTGSCGGDFDSNTIGG